jgi:hypothetical protein
VRSITEANTERAVASGTGEGVRMARWGLAVRSSAVCLSLALTAAGCATNSDVSAARAEAAEAKRVADEANQKASAAAADAAAARAAADAAAEEARKADRIFQHSLHK